MDNTSDSLRETNETSKFGFNVGDLVEIISGGPFCGQIQKVVGFTSIFAICSVSGPSGEPDCEWWFEPNELKHFQKNINPSLN